MPFEGYLSVNELSEVTTAVVDSGLIEIDRSLQLLGIPKTFAFGLKRDSNPLDQFQLDIGKINDVERLEGGQVPLLQFLQNLAFQARLRSRKEGKTFEQFANRVGNRARGVPTLPEPTRLPEVTKNEAIIGIDEMVDFSFLAAGAEAGRSITRLTVPRFEGGTAIQSNGGVPWVMRGTAWVIGPDLLITNHHVLNARRNDEARPSASDFARQAAESTIEFDYDTGKEPVLSSVHSVLIFSESLDYAVMKLADPPQRPPLQLATERAEFKATSYVPVNIIQHPRGVQKRVAFRNNLVSGVDDDTIRYFTDTDIGSSGSPVCDDNWRVLALHRGARYVEGVNFQGKSTAYVNFGSQISALLNDMKLKSPSLHGEVMSGQRRR